jgi:DNA-binding GntR family transcriptional regulator
MQYSIDQNLTRINASPTSLKQKVYTNLQRSIIELEYKPGELLRKQELCKEFGISRTPLSEAIALLMQDGLVEVVPQAGTYVARLSMDDLHEGAFIREALELAAIKLLADIITEPQLVKLKRNLRLQRVFIDDEDFQGFYALDAQFHAMLLDFTGFEKLNRVANSAWINVDRVRRLLLPIAERVEETYQEHVEIFGTLERRHPTEASNALEKHLGKLMTYITPLEKSHPEYFT